MKEALHFVGFVMILAGLYMLHPGLALLVAGVLLFSIAGKP